MDNYMKTDKLKSIILDNEQIGIWIIEMDEGTQDKVSDILFFKQCGDMDLTLMAKLSGDIPFESVENVMVDIKFAVDNLENAITKERDIDEKIVNILIHPEMGAVMHCEEHTKDMLSIE